MNLLSEAATIDRINAIESQIATLRVESYMRAGLPIPSQCGRISNMTETAARLFDVTVAEIRGPARGGAVVRARFAVMWAARRVYGFSTPHLGRHLGGRDHTTVLNALIRVEQLRGADEEFRVQTDALVALFQPKSEDAENAPSSH